MRSSVSCVYMAYLSHCNLCDIHCPKNTAHQSFVIFIGFQGSTLQVYTQKEKLSSILLNSFPYIFEVHVIASHMDCLPCRPRVLDSIFLAYFPHRLAIELMLDGHGEIPHEHRRSSRLLLLFFGFLIHKGSIVDKLRKVNLPRLPLLRVRLAPIAVFPRYFLFPAHELQELIFPIPAPGAPPIQSLRMAPRMAIRVRFHPF